MKQKDITNIVGAALFSLVLSLVLARVLIATPKNRQQKVEVVQPISSQFKNPSNQYFNDKESIDPTVIIRIGDTKNPNPL